ncbi:M16 family metallopeptidase [Erythrobacter sp. 3-20A1M]|uniref:M16 family metallopeptidase n=1 Tax=Erythrobacter sp. 3-20A1M TaxID=2653850 RepID=UPI0035303714
MRVALESRKTLFAGQRLAERLPIGTLDKLEAATPKAVKAFHDRWYRPENVVISIAGDVDPKVLAAMIEKYYGDWKVKAKATPAPDFGDPVAPKGVDADNPVGQVAVEVEPDLPRSFTYAVLRPWRKVNDTIEYNEGLMMDQLAQALINRRLEAKARAGGSFLYAQVQQQDVSRSVDGTFVSFAPLTEDWQAALTDVRGVIADALATPPTQEEIDREVSELEVAFKAGVAERDVQAGGALANNIASAVDIRETTASPETVLSVFQGMQAKITPEAILEHTRALFEGDVVRAVYTTPAAGEASDAALRTALLAPVDAASDVRLAARTISFADLPPIGTPGTVVSTTPLGVLGIDRVELSNGVTALLWSNDAEPGRVAVNVRFGSGYRAFDAKDAPYIALGESALIGSGLGDLGQEDLDRLSTGRKLGFDFGIDDANFTFDAQTRKEDLADQLYLFAAKLGMPRWDDNPVLRSQAAARLAYDTFATSPAGLIQRDLDYLLSGKDARYETQTPEMIAQTTPEGFRKVWEPLLKQGPIEVSIFGDFDQAKAIEALENTFGALPPREPIPADASARVPGFPDPQPVTVEYHRGDANQAAALIAWQTGGGIENLRESRQLEILTQLFNNRLLEEMRERAGASYAPVVRSDWPVDVPSGGNIAAFAQLRPQDVPVFFAAAQSIAEDLAKNPPSADELERVTEPLRQQVMRASTGNTFWMWQLAGASTDPRRVALTRSLLVDYSQTTPERMQALAQKYLGDRAGYRAAFIPEGQTLATALPTGTKAAEALSSR